MNSWSDQELLREYAERHSEPAFAELVRRHLDAVYSAALRLVGEPHAAQDVTQAAWLALAQQARSLARHPVLSGWLHRTTRNLAANVIRKSVRQRAREVEAVAMNTVHSTEPEAPWQQIAPELDAALEDLSDPDRDALFLRFFERKSASAMARTLGVNDEAAQKRVRRAVDRLRVALARRGVVVGAPGLALMLTAHAVQAAPAGLAVAVTTIAALSGAAWATPAAATLAMTTLQKTLVTATVAVLATTGLYQARQAAQWRREVQRLNEAQAPAAEQLQQLKQERDDATNRLELMAAAVAKVKVNSAELLKLRGEVSRLRRAAQSASDPFVSQALDWQTKRQRLQQLAERPDQRVPELQFLGDQDWLDLARNEDLDSPEGIRQALSSVRRTAKNRFAPMLEAALRRYVHEQGKQTPASILELQPYFGMPVDEALLRQYALIPGGPATDVTSEFVVVEAQVIDPDNDERWWVGPNGYGTFAGARQVEAESDRLQPHLQALQPALEAFKAAHQGALPQRVAELKPFISTPEQQTALNALAQENIGFARPQ